MKLTEFGSNSSVRDSLARGNRQSSLNRVSRCRRVGVARSGLNAEFGFLSTGRTVATPDSLRGRGEEFQCDVVGVTAGQPRAVIGIDDAPVGDTEFFEPGHPCLEIATTSTGERQVVQTNSTFIKREGVSWIGEFVQTNERLTFDKPDSSSKRAGAFVSVKHHAEESFVPLDTAVEITDRQRHVSDRRELGHGGPLMESMNFCPVHSRRR